MSLKHLKQPKRRMEQLRMFAECEMPRELVAPLEKDLVERIRAVLGKMGYHTWSGRIAIYDVSEEARQERAARGWPPFLPALGAGCPDILGIFPDQHGRLFGLECKRADGDKERAAQKAWKELADYWGIPTATVRSVEEAVSFLTKVTPAPAPAKK